MTLVLRMNASPDTNETAPLRSFIDETIRQHALLDMAGQDSGTPDPLSASSLFFAISHAKIPLTPKHHIKISPGQGI